MVVSSILLVVVFARFLIGLHFRLASLFEEPVQSNDEPVDLRIADRFHGIFVGLVLKVMFRPWQCLEYVVDGFLANR